MFRFEITKWQVCKECGGNGCDTCEGTGKIYLGEITPAELVEYWQENFPEVFGPPPTEEKLEELRKIFEVERNEQNKN